MDKKPTIVPKGRYRLKYRGTECLNCGHLLDMSDKYCPGCSQANSTKKLSLKDFLDEFFSSLISYDSRLLKTLSALLIRPGQISKDYVLGKRVSYTNPFRFLLSLAIIYFLMLNFSGNFTELNRLGADNDQSFSDLEDEFDFPFVVVNEEEEEALKILDSLKVNDKLDRFIQKKDSTIIKNPKKYFLSLKDNSFFKRYNYKLEFFIPSIQKDTLASFDEMMQKYDIDDTFENKTAFSVAESFLKVSQQPGSFMSSMISKLPFATFFFLPLFALFISLAYIRKNYTYTDNLIFSFHNQSLLFILLIVSFLVDYIFNTDSAKIFILVFAIYLYKAMRKFYGQGRFKTILKYIFLNTVFIILASVAAVILIIGSAFTY